MMKRTSLLFALALAALVGCPKKDDDTKPSPDPAAEGNAKEKGPSSNKKKKNKSDDDDETKKHADDKPIEVKKPEWKTCQAPTKLAPMGGFDLPVGSTFSGFSLDGKRVFAQNDAGVISSLELATGKILATNPMLPELVATNDDGSIQLVRTPKGIERVDAATGKHTAISPTVVPVDIDVGALSEDGSFLAYDGVVVDLNGLKGYATFQVPFAGGADGAPHFVGRRTFIDENGRASGVYTLPESAPSKELEPAYVETRYDVTPDGKHALTLPHVPFAMDYDDSFDVCTLGVDPCVTLPVHVASGKPSTGGICITGGLVAIGTGTADIQFFSYDGKSATSAGTLKAPAPYDLLVFPPDGLSLAVIAKNHLSLFRLGE